eukprot:GCRY01007618.1.p2 GENE.GCRY01007618.1~~GCRY01007618.1.p2  ORF type:complete len:103 (-),score=27.09 GCRY01007618.1:133-441(-)
MFFAHMPFSLRRFYFEAVAVVVLSLIVAVSVPNLALVFALTGATAGVAISYLLPTGFFIYLSPEPRFSRRKLCAWAVFVMGSITSVFCTIIALTTDQEEEEL